jgi:hypothetical protein
MSPGRPRAFVGHRPMADCPSSFFEPPPPPSRRPERREFPSRRPWWGTPKNELGAPVPLRLILGLTDRVAVAVVGATAYTTGVSLTVSVRRRESLAANDFEDVDEFYDDPFEPPFGHPGRRRRRVRELAPEILRFGLQFSDGRKATTTGELFPWVDLDDTDEREPTGPVLMSGGGGGGNREWEAEFWLWPVPPPGPLAFVIEWPSEKIELTKREVDAALFIEASRSSEELWPEASSDETSRSRQFVIGTDSAASEPDPDEDERETLDESDN